MKNDVQKWMESEGESFLKDIGIKKGQTVLDFGCGEGHYTIPAARVVGENGKVFALDKDKNTLDRLNKMLKHYNIRNVKLLNEKTKTSLKDNSVDVVLCYDVLHYSNKKERNVIYNEIHRVLKRKGILSVYPKHYKKDYPLLELADLDLDEVVEELAKAGFILHRKFSKNLLHDDYYNEGYILNLRRS